MLISENGGYFKLIFSSTQILWSFDFRSCEQINVFFKYFSEEDIKVLAIFGGQFKWCFTYFRLENMNGSIKGLQVDFFFKLLFITVRKESIS